MSQSHHGENSSTFNNNDSFNNNTNLNSFNTSSFNNTNNMLNLGSVDEMAEVLAWLLRWDPGYGTRILEPTEPKMWETGCYE